MKRLLSIATLYPNGHAPRFGTFVAQQMEALATRGDWDVTVINPVGTPPFAPGRYAALAKAAVSGRERRVQVYRPRFTLIPAVGGPFNPMMICRAVLPLAHRLHAAAPFDLVDAQFFYPDGPAAAQVASELELPLSIKARGADISLWGRKPYALKKMRAAATQAAGLLAVSTALAEDMAAIGLPRDKITVHYTGLDRSLFRPRSKGESRARVAAQCGLSLPAGAPLLATVGALIPRKGQALVVRALADLPGAHLLLVGKGPDQAMLAELAAGLGLAGRVHFLGSLDHSLLPLVLAAADAMVLPSASEGLANAWVEALGCGTPVVITDVGGARELVTGSAAGRIVAPDVAEIVAAVRALLASPPDPSVVAASVARFSWQASASALADYYEGLVAAA
jgi:glycosyltransferase involved in cell wall biosynthesis